MIFLAVGPSILRGLRRRMRAKDWGPSYGPGCSHRHRSRSTWGTCEWCSGHCFSHDRYRTILGDHFAKLAVGHEEEEGGYDCDDYAGYYGGWEQYEERWNYEQYSEEER